MTLSFAGLANPLVQRFKYDSLYRMTEATERSGTEISSTQNWVQNYGYDRFGNRLSFAQNIGGISKNTTPTIDANSNRFVAGQGFVYDKNGNITNDLSDSSQNRQFVFNGENKQTEVKDANGNPIGKYFYDGEGRRVKKVTDAETTIFVYSSGKLVAEYSTKLADNPSTNYTTTDHLGTPRVITNELGQVKSRRDFMPFGEELTINVGGRSQTLKYGTSADDIRQKFTGYQKDEETKLDFAEARMYENRHARFTAVDPLLASGKSANPQTFNRYIYVGNNPLNITDPLGLDWYSRYNKETERTDYNEFEEDPGNEWNHVDFKGGPYLRLNNVCGANGCNETKFIYQSGGIDGGSRAAFIERSNQNSFWGNLGDAFLGIGKETLNLGIGFSNTFWTGAGYASHEFIFSGRPRQGMPHTEYFQPDSQAQADSMWSTGQSLTAISIYGGGSGALKSKPVSFSLSNSEMVGGSAVEILQTNSFKFTDNVRASSLKAIADDVRKNGIQNPIEYTVINGERYIINGNHRMILANKLGFETVPARRVSLPRLGFQNKESVLYNHSNYGNPFTSPQFRYWSIYYKPSN